jgi:ABC-type lipoprotein export system ATPase subunit
MPVAELHNLRKLYRQPDGATQVVLDIEQWSLEQGRHVALIGDSGSGKTTLLHILAGVLRPDAGRVVVCGTDLAGLGEAACDRFRGRHVGYVFQTFNLLQGFSALENVEMAMRLAGAVDRERARMLLGRVGLEARLHHQPRQLSVGQQQRVAVARALANRPSLVLADEPTGNLDAASGRAVMNLLHELCRWQEAALLVATHDARWHEGFDQIVSLSDFNRAADAREVPA